MKILNKDNEISAFVSRLNIDSLQFFTWRIQGSDVFKVEIEKANVLKKSQEIVLEFKNSKDMEFFVSNQDYLNLFCPEESIIMRMKLLKISDEKTLRCSWPETLAIVDRRKKLREDFSDFEKVYIDIPVMNIVKKSLYDLSFNGLSFIASKDEKRYLKSKEEFEFELHISQEIFKLRGKIVYVKEISRDHHENFLYGGAKIGIHLTAQNEEFLEWLQKIIQ